MSRQIIDLEEILNSQLEDGDLLPVEDISVPRTKKLTVTQLAAALAKRNTPIGSLYINADVSTNPAILLGFGTWVEFGKGRVLVGVDTTQSEFSGLGQQGGAKTVALTEANNGPHSHHVNDPGHSHSMSAILDNFGGGNTNNALTNYPGANVRIVTKNTGGSGTGVWLNGSGSGTPHANLQPYVTVYIWRRTA